MTRPLQIAASLVISFAAFTAFGQTAPAPDTTSSDTTPTAATSTSTVAIEDAAVVGDIDRGRDLTFTCMGCHGIRGYENAYPTYHVPLIGGQSEQYLINALTEYQEGKRSHPTMQAQTAGLSQQQIADIAAFLSSLKK